MSTIPMVSATIPRDPRWRSSRRVALLLLGAAVVVGLGRSILDTYFTQRVVDLPPPPPATWAPLAKRVALVVLDGLRPMEAFNPDYMPALSERRAQAAWGIARSGEITMTVPGVRMLGSGVSSDFMEILHNWTPRSSPVTSLFTVAKMKGLHTVLCGDHVWKRAFTNDIDRHLDTRLDAWSYYSDPVHAPDQSHFEDLRDLLSSGEPFDLLVVHFVGPDHASHRHRVTSPEFQEYTRWIDPKLDELLTSLVAAGTTILVTSDHGMSDWGQHGGDEPTARKTPYLLQGPGIKVGPGPLLDQSDLPATLAALLGLPMPPAGEGRVAHEVLAAPPETVLAIMRVNLDQARTYLAGYQKNYERVPAELLDNASIWEPSKGSHTLPRSGSAGQSPASPSRLDLGKIAAQQGIDEALAKANLYFDHYREQRRSVAKSVARTWAWLFAILVFVVFGLLPQATPPRLLPGAVLAAGVALLLSIASWATTAALWPSVIAVLVASSWLARGNVPARLWPPGARTALTVFAVAAISALLAVAHLGFRRQFRSDTMLPGVSDAGVRTASYVVALLAATVYVGCKRLRAAEAPTMDARAEPWTIAALVGVFLLMLPSGKLLLMASPGLGLGMLWLHRLARIAEAEPRIRLASVLESEWFLLVLTLAWVCLESWFAVIAPLVDQQRGALGWILNRLPWLLAPALVYQQIAVHQGLAGRRLLPRLLSIVSLAMTLPPLLFAHHTTLHSNLLVWLALLAMLAAAANFRARTAKYQLGAATFALAGLFGSASYALLCLVLAGTYWAFLTAPRRSEPSIPGTRSSVAPMLAALAAYFVWLTVHRFRDGSFSFSDIEVTVAFYGNPVHGLGQGVVQVSARFILPMVLLLIPLQRLQDWSRIFAGIIAALLLHIGVLLIGFLATQTQFYTPYRLAGELVHFIALLVAVPLLFLIFGARGNQPEDEAASAVSSC